MAMAADGPAAEDAADPVLLVGLPRSGTTWVARALGAAADVHAVLEPDNEDNYPYAIRAKAGLGRYPIVTPGTQPPTAYQALWEGAFRGGRAVSGPRGALSNALHAAARRRTSVHLAERWSRSRRRLLDASVALAGPCGPAPQRAVVKSVFCLFALGWLLERWRPSLVVVRRSPWSTVASWMRRGWDPPFFRHPRLGWPEVDRDLLGRLLPGRPLPPTPPPSQQVRRLAWELAVLMSAMVTAVDAADVGIVEISHEDLCKDPVTGFRDLYARVGLTWTPRTTQYLRSADAAGDGVYDTKRLARDEPSRWRTQLSEVDVVEIRNVVAGFGLHW